MSYHYTDIFSIKQYSLGKYVRDKPKRRGVVSFMSSEVVEDSGKKVTLPSQFIWHIDTDEDKEPATKKQLDKGMEYLLSNPIDMPGSDGLCSFSNAKELFINAPDVTEQYK